MKSKKYNQELNLELRKIIENDKRFCKVLIEKEKQSPGTVLEPRDCPVCGETHYSEIINNGFFDYRRCLGCTLLYMSPCINDRLYSGGLLPDDEHAQDYWKLMKKDVTPGDERTSVHPERHPILRDLVPYKSEGRLLDVGCSIGNFLYDAQAFYNVEGLEINLETAEIARERGLVIHTTPIEQLTGEKEYDIITFNQLLRCLKNPLVLFENAARLLKKNGILYVNTGNADSISLRIFKGDHTHVLSRRHMNVFNKKSLQKVSEICGLSIQLFYTEWFDVFLLDLWSYIFKRDLFIHRRNHFIPFYAKWTEIEEKVQAFLFGNKFRTIGDYCICIMKKLG